MSGLLTTPQGGIYGCLMLLLTIFPAGSHLNTQTL